MASVKKIFLVDDDAVNNEMLKMHLQKKFNLEIITFSNGEDCIRNLSSNPDYIVLDYRMSNSDNPDAADGLEILKRIKQINPDIYIIFLSGQEKIEVAVDTIKYGAYDYIVKNQSSFLRLENCLTNISKHQALVRQAKAYKFSTFLLGGVIVGIIVLAIVLKALGIAVEWPEWI